MTPVQTLPRSEWSISLLLIPTWIAFSNVVSLSGALLWVIIPSLVAVQTMFVMISADRRILAGVVLVFLTLLSGALSELLGGQTSGSITRSTLMMTSCAGLMALLWRTRFPATAVTVSLAALAGALGLGAAHRIVWLVGVWIVAVVAYLAAVGPLRTIDLGDRGRLKSLAAILLAAGLAGSGAGNALYRVMGDPWTIRSIGPIALGGVADPSSAVPAPQGPQASDSATVAGSVSDASGSGRPPRASDLGSVGGSEEGVSIPKESTPDSGSGTANVAQAGPQRSWVEILALAVLALLGFLVVLVALWVARVQIKWMLLRVQLRRGTPAEQVAGAWHWLRFRWAQSDYVDYVNLTPDRISRLAAERRDPVLEELARAATEALYSHHPELNAQEVARAWQNAKTLRARAAVSWPSRMRSLLVTPSAAIRREPAHNLALLGQAMERRIVR
jgi:hypothetical protein